jgi:hypothetical protein
MKYQRKLILLLICCMGTTNGAMAYTMSAFARNIGVTDTIASSHHLKEVVITSDYLKREADHILAIPTAEQRKHANNGYDFIRNLMIPGVNVDRNKNIVTTPVGRSNTVYQRKGSGFHVKSCHCDRRISNAWSTMTCPRASMPKMQLPSTLY